MQKMELLLKRLIDHDIDFVVVGGFAAVAYGVTLVTQDIDICCRFSDDNLAKLQEALSDLNPVHRMTPNRIPLKIAPEQYADLNNLYLSTDWGQLDCMGTITGLGNYDDVLRQSMTIELDFGTCRIITIDALIKSKEAIGRPRDNEAVIQLEAIRERLRES